MEFWAAATPVRAAIHRPKAHARAVRPMMRRVVVVPWRWARSKGRTGCLEGRGRGVEPGGTTRVGDGGGRILNETASALLVPITHQGKGGGMVESDGRIRTSARVACRGLPCSMLPGRADVQLPAGSRPCGSATGSVFTARRRALLLIGQGRRGRRGGGLVARRGRHGVLGATAGPAEAAWRCGGVFRGTRAMLTE